MIRSADWPGRKKAMTRPNLPGVAKKPVEVWRTRESIFLFSAISLIGSSVMQLRRRSVLKSGISALFDPLLPSLPEEPNYDHLSLETV